MEQVETSEPVVITKNRRVRLVLLGLIQVALGTLGIIATPVIVIGLDNTLNGNGMKSYYLMLDSFFWFLSNLSFSAFLLVLGIGSINARPWARSLSIVLGWITLIASPVSVVMLVRLYPMLEELRRAERDMPPQAPDFAFGIFMLVTAVLLMGLPLLLVLGYGGKHVRATCKRMHPEPSWTDRLPISVTLTAGLVFMIGMMLLVWIGSVQIDFLGVPTSIPTKNLLVLIFVLLHIVVAWGLFGLKSWAWWASIIVLGLHFLPVTLPQPAEIFDLMAFPEMLESRAPVIVSELELGGLAYVVVSLVMLVATRKYFRRTSSGAQAKEALSTAGKEENEFPGDGQG